jgi:hypothetical protein
MIKTNCCCTCNECLELRRDERMKVKAAEDSAYKATQSARDSRDSEELSCLKQ